MGNCCMRHSSSMVWAGDDWGSMGRNDPSPSDEKEGLLGGGGGGAELRIKISRKQLDELLGKAEGGGAWRSKKKEEGRVLEGLIERSVQVEVRRRRSWRPKLHSIPELC